MDDHVAQLRSCMYQYSRAIYRSIKDLVDPYVDSETRVEYRRIVLAECELTMERLADDPQYFAASRSRAVRRHPPILPDHRAGPGRLGRSRGRLGGGVVHRAAARSRALRRWDLAVQGDHPQGQGMPAHPAPRPRLLPLAPAPRAFRSKGRSRRVGHFALTRRNAPAGRKVAFTWRFPRDRAERAHTPASSTARVETLCRTTPTS